MLDALPLHIILCITDELDFTNVCKLNLICKALARLMQSREFWNHRAQMRKHISPSCFNDFCAEFPPNIVPPRFLYTKLIYWQTAISSVTISIDTNQHLSVRGIDTLHAASLTQFSDFLGTYIILGYIIPYIDDSGIWKGKILFSGWRAGSIANDTKEFQDFCNRISNNIDDFLVRPTFALSDMRHVTHFNLIKKA